VLLTAPPKNALLSDDKGLKGNQNVTEEEEELKKQNEEENHATTRVKRPKN
jgi:hypothetical protein